MFAVLLTSYFHWKKKDKYIQQDGKMADQKKG